MAIKVNGSGAEQGFGSRLNRLRLNKDFFKSLTKLPSSRFRDRDSGLKIAVVREGKGKPLAKGMTVVVNYTGWLESGKKFDSSVDKGKPFEITLGAGQVIKGWEEGLAGIKPGERRQLIIPARLAYGNRRVGKIPPNATLIFNVEAVSVKDVPSSRNGKISVVA